MGGELSCHTLLRRLFPNQLCSERRGYLSGGSTGMKFANSAAVILSLLCLPTAALAQEVMSAPDPASAGFSPNRLTRIDAWYQAQIDAGSLPGAVVAIARNGKLA